MSLLQDVLRSYSANPAQRQQLPDHKDDSDDDYINVVSLPNTPGATRPSSPTGRNNRPVRPLIISSSRKDPLRAFPTEVSQRIFNKLPVRDLAKCALVCKKWGRSQTINYGAY
ncbi:hypothetical protein EST38_g10776 [Candolleomyces aberdarensis]|uniref:F-box domain-containing protein n=1 Tax=Candolleomyces aberdarensis TaxID=2316362 RepID=A0A4Q2D6J1_9AGAR|nr:hypothetical protein EST38_g10776 [Candolleomyces aberdarensis]